MTTNDLMHYFARMGFTAFLLAWAGLHFGFTGRIMLVALLLAIGGSAGYIHHQLGQRASRRSYITRKNMLLSCLLPAIAMLGSVLLLVTNLRAFMTQG